MAETTLLEAVESRGPYAVWDLMDEDEKKAAAVAFWNGADRESRSALEMALATELKFRQQSVRQLSAERVAGRLVRLADSLPESVLFQYLFHLHMDQRRPLMVSYLDAVGLPHDDGALDLPDDFEGPDAEKVEKAGRDLAGSEGKTALVYLATLLVADADFWMGLEPVLKEYSSEGEVIT
ncbi:MAG: hypothetical protein LJE93_12585 [Acidobacteria bacterium]|jgi:hypothetical protein|nr:hypothetical protein [Acidobacteriota bacterium]